MPNLPHRAPSALASVSRNARQRAHSSVSTGRHWRSTNCSMTQRPTGRGHRQRPRLRLLRLTIPVTLASRSASTSLFSDWPSIATALLPTRLVAWNRLMRSARCATRMHLTSSQSLRTVFPRSRPTRRRPRYARTRLALPLTIRVARPGRSRTSRSTRQSQFLILRPAIHFALHFSITF